MVINFWGKIGKTEALLYLLEVYIKSQNFINAYSPQVEQGSLVGGTGYQGVRGTPAYNGGLGANLTPPLKLKALCNLPKVTARQPVGFELKTVESQVAAKPPTTYSNHSAMQKII